VPLEAILCHGIYGIGVIAVNLRPTGIGWLFLYPVLMLKTITLQDNLQIKLLGV
jgi:hypothetical protein